MDLKRLEYFLKIADLGSINRATEYLHIGQPSLSRQMRLLEEELGVQLFKRHRRGMQLTMEGQELQQRLKGPIRQVGLALHEVRSLSGAAAGEVTIGMVAATAVRFAARLVTAIAQSDPHIKVRIVEGFAGNFVRALEGGELDIALLQGPSSHWQFSAETILIEDLVLIGGADSALSAERPVEFKELPDYPLILPSPRHYPDVIRRLSESSLSGFGRALNIVINADASHLVHSYVRAGLGYGLVPLSGCYNEIVSGAMKYAPIVNPSMPLELLMATYPASRFPRATERAKNVIRNELKDMVRTGAWIAARTDS